MIDRRRAAALAALIAAGGLAGCVTPVATSDAGATRAAQSGLDVAPAADFQRDRAAILAMAGEYKVTFDFIETVPYLEGYNLKDRKLSGGHEVVRVIEDTGDFISLQHLLVVGDDDNPFVVKHWRQDWRYEPEDVLVFIGGNAWETRTVSARARAGAWSQTVYQVDDSPRYGAVGQWTYENGLAEWTPPREMRPLPRRDMTTRDDYHAIDAVNRHTVASWGWVHEQDNSKLILSGAPRVLAREVAVNTYRRFDAFPVQAADDYWTATKAYWAGVRAEWARVAAENPRFAIALKGETEDLYNPLLGLAVSVQDGDMTAEEAVSEAQKEIANYVTADIGALESRLRSTLAPPQEY